MFMYMCICVCVCVYMEVKMFVTQSYLTLSDPWTAACQSPPSMGFSRQECWSGVPFPSAEHLPDPGVEPTSPAL